MIERLLGLHLNLRVALAVGLFLIFSRIVVKFHVRTLVMLGSLGVAQHLRTRLLIVVVVEFNLAGSEPALARPLVDMLLLAAIRGGERNKRNRRETRQRR